ncbi:hypothetical protein M3T53_05960 [Actinomyces sp. B33]|uniref:hypothetical protein n=1 Tax=Actinomyces sp. B33 TaxID=2942131 RepID=UPI00233F864D|nr:hypothetical protein [Actinomyces sp. B33]MDC4233254.1 hypothetical protein [Actinomyces sp. B33]
MNTTTRTVSVHDTLFGRQANNLDVAQLSEAVKPWYADCADSKIAQAIEDLRAPELRGDAARFLGLEVIPVA